MFDKTSIIQFFKTSLSQPISEKQLIQSITGRKVPAFALPSAIGVVVHNVSTTKAIYDAVVLGKPLYEKVVTISGKGIKRQANLLVKVGTKLSDIVNRIIHILIIAYSSDQVYRRHPVIVKCRDRCHNNGHEGPRSLT